ncbi:hypothetical protein AVHM3334_06190 [Acidovorax sp. SUPP3334]|nr:hypothetical protein AVHM3334_06190 [Acidovorax sp. SUPP3334]
MQSQHACDLGRVGLRGRKGLLHVGEDGAHPRQIGLARIGERHPAGGALQQPGTDVALQVGDQPRDGRRRQIHGARGCRKAALVHHGLEHAHRQQSIHFRNDGISRAAIISISLIIHCPECCFSKG